VVVLFGGQTVDHDVADALAVGFAGRVEPETNLHEFVLQVPVDGLRHPDHSDLAALGQKVLRQQPRVGVRVVAPDDYQPVQAQCLAVLKRIRKLLRLFDLVPARTYHVKATSVLVLEDDVLSQLLVAVRVNADWAVQKAIQS
jgi:hypothetical protein